MGLPRTYYAGANGAAIFWFAWYYRHGLDHSLTVPFLAGLLVIANFSVWLGLRLAPGAGGPRGRR